MTGATREELVAWTKGRFEFSDLTPGLQILWSASALDKLKTCPRLYYYSKLRRFVAKKKTEPLIFGVTFHKILEAYELKLATGVTHREALLHAVKLGMEISVERTPDPDGDKAFDTWQSIFSGEDTRRTRRTLIRAVVWTLEQYQAQALNTRTLADGSPAVEIKFELSLGINTENGEEVLAYGFLDKIVEYGTLSYILDRKSTASQLSPQYFDRYSPDNQVSLYTLAGNVCYPETIQGMIIEATQLAVGFNRTSRGIVNRTESTLHEWLADTQHWVRQAEQYAKQGNWPMNDASCGKYGGCDFQSICKKDPAVRETFLQSNFTMREQLVDSADGIRG